jgi:agmatinase
VTLTPEEYGVRVRSCLGPDRGPVYLSFDIDVLDPASAPGTGFDVVEVALAYDSPGQITAVNAAAVAFDLLALPAVTRR